MKIAVITDGIDDSSAGVGTYARGLASTVQEVSPHPITFVHRRPHEFYRDLDDLVFRGWGSKLVRKQVLLPRALNSAGFDLVHETFHFPPFFGSNAFHKVMTIHDMTPFVLPARNMAYPNWLWHRLLLPPLARRADHVLTDSQNSKRDIVRVLGLRPERVSVAYLAAEDAFHPRTEREAADVRARYGLPERFLLFVGTIEPRKNLLRLLRAFEHAKGMSGPALVIVGALGWRYGPFLRAVRRSPVRDRVFLLGRVPHDDLPLLYNAAVALAYVPIYEGFGLPPLEAMQSGCPVLTSNTSSIPEVVADAALTIDPTDDDALVAALERIDADKQLRGELRHRGLCRAKGFSWRQCSEATVAAYERALAA